MIRRFLMSLVRANSHWRYHAYRKSIGSPLRLRDTTAEWVRRFVFEWKHNGRSV